MRDEFRRAARNGLEGAFSLVEGNPITAARYFLAAVLDLVTPTAASQMLTDEGVRRANEAADAYESAKFLGNPPFGKDQ